MLIQVIRLRFSNGAYAPGRVPEILNTMSFNMTKIDEDIHMILGGLY